MSQAHSLIRLQLLTTLCHQLPDHEADALLLLAVDDPTEFTAEVLGACADGRLRLPRHMESLLQRDLLLAPTA